MGTPVAVTYANIVLYYLESKGLDETKPILYLRYIDDLFVIARDVVSANQLVTIFNSRCPSIQLDAVTTGSSGVFLDMEMTIVSGHVETKLFQKQMNKYLYLPPTTQHAKHVLRNVIVQELKRYRLYCTKDTDFFEMKSLFHTRLKLRGYSDDYLLPLFAKVLNRQELYQASLSRSKNKITTNNNNNINKTSPIISILLPQLIHPVNLRSFFALPPEITDLAEYKRVFGENKNIIVGRRNYPSIGRLLIFRPLVRDPLRLRISNNTNTNSSSSIMMMSNTATGNPNEEPDPNPNPNTEIVRELSITYPNPNPDRNPSPDPKRRRLQGPENLVG